MPSIISFGPKLIRINHSKNSIEQSFTRGQTWTNKHSGSLCGTFIDLVAYGNEIIALTDNGIYYSATEGSTWISRCTSPIVKTFTCIQDGGGELIGMTADGHIYASETKGATWIKRR